MKFIEKHPKFFESVIFYMWEHKYDEKFINDFKNAVDTFEKFNMELIEIIYEGLEKITYEILYSMLNIKIIKI